MHMGHCSRSRTNSLSPTASLSGSGEILNSTSLTYQNLNDLAIREDVVKLEQNDHFFVITHPTKINSFTAGAPYLGWKLHLSIKGDLEKVFIKDDLKKVFNLIAPIISRYKLCFKVVNTEMPVEPRFLLGEQITIYLEEEEKAAITEQEVGELMAEIHRTLLLNGIEPGIKPESDARTESSFFSIRNDKCKPLLTRKMMGYVSPRVAGAHFNPSNNPNPFSNLLKEEVTPFDPMEHFELFAAQKVENITFRLIDTMKACINEYTNFEMLDDELKETFIHQYCRENDDGNTEFIKEAYKNNPDILMAVKHAFSILYRYEDDVSQSKINYLEYVTAAQLSQYYSDKNSFKKLMQAVEENAAQRLEQNQRMLVENTVSLSLLELYVKRVLAQNSKLVFPLPNFSKNTSLIIDVK